jgi:hypothetical protein
MWVLLLSPLIQLPLIQLQGRTSIYLPSSGLSVVDARSVAVELSAPWPRYALSNVAEVAEFVSEQDSESFWKFTERICASSASIEEQKRVTEEGAEGAADARAELQSLALEAGTDVLPKAFQYILETSLKLSAYAPALRYFESIATAFGDPCNGDAFIVAYPGAKVFCAVEGGSGAISYLEGKWNEEQQNKKKKEKGEKGDTDENTLLWSNAEDCAGSGSASKSADTPYVFPEEDVSPLWDHVFPSRSAHLTSPTRKGGALGARLVLYGSLGSASLCAHHASLVQAQTEPASRTAPSEKTRGSHSQRTFVYSYHLRHAFPGARTVSEATSLQGYGVHLDIKNMEYKNVDDSPAAPQQQQQQQQEEEGGEGGESPEAAAERREAQLLQEQEEEEQQAAVGGVFGEGESTAGVVFATLLRRSRDRTQKGPGVRELKVLC